jgi:hypothetical protein
MPDPTPATTASISGTLNIGTAPNVIPIKLDTVLPPKTPGVFVFDYAPTNPDTPAVTIPVGAFMTWATGQLGAVGIAAGDLPTSLQTLAVNVEKLHLDTAGNYDVKVELGTETAGAWSATWKPISSLPLTLDGVTFDVTNMPPPAAAAFVQETSGRARTVVRSATQRPSAQA